MIEEGIMATEITDGQVIHVCLPQNNEITHIDVCWQDEVTMNLDLSLMYILSGQKEIQDYVNQTSKPEIDNYIEIQAKPIVSDVIEEIATPTINEYFEGTVKASISEFAEKEMAEYAQIASASAQEATEISNRMDTVISEFNNASDELLSEVEQTVSQSSENVKISKVWAEGKQSEVENLGGELSSKGWASEAEKSATQAKDAAEKLDNVLTVVEGGIGDIGFAPLGIDETQNKRRYLNGQVISQAQFASFTNKIKSAIELYPSLATTEENWQAEVTNSKLGQCGKFVIDDTLGTIRLPKVVNINGLQDLSLMGSIKSESLPNITGVIKPGATSYGALAQGSGNGALYTISTGWNGLSATATASVGDKGAVGFDASLSSSTYRDEAPVQQESVQYPYFIQVATGVEESVDVTREIELNNPFSLLDYKWSEYELSNASWLISNGQFNSGAVYVSVYELLLKIYNGTETKDGISVKLSTEAYEDTDFVLNTADTTFRLPIKVKLASGNMIVGNGMTLGITNGTNNFGLARLSEISALTGNVDGYGSNIGTTPGSYGSLGNNTFGITTDPLKSGIETSSDGLKLYFYVGETIQNANVINASGVLTKVSNGIDRTSATDRETVVGWGIPDYTTSITWTCPSKGSTYTIPYDCELFFSDFNNGAGVLTLKINNSSGATIVNMSCSNNSTVVSDRIKLKKGTILYIVNNRQCTLSQITKLYGVN